MLKSVIKVTSIGSRIKKLLTDYGYGFVFNNPSSVCVTSFICQFRNRRIDTFKQEWYGTLSNRPVLGSYRVFKPTL